MKRLTVYLPIVMYQVKHIRSVFIYIMKTVMDSRLLPRRRQSAMCFTQYLHSGIERNLSISYLMI